MNYESFYGGRRGTAFVIVESFPTIDEMITEFKKGGNYKTVNYEEYVLIDTKNKNDKDNGKVFRRGYDYLNEENGGAIYVGQIVGPAGPAPHLQFDTIEEIKNTYNEYKSDPNFVVRPQDKLKEFEYITSESLVPGKYVENGIEKYNDSIKWVSCSIRTEDNSNTTAYIGFRIPYTVIEYDASTVDPYYHRDNNSENFKNINLTERLDTEEHPFYEKWHISIPKGIKGDTFKNFRITTVAEEQANHPGWLQNYPGMDDDAITEDIIKERKILVYDYYHYDKNGNGEPISLYIGDYNVIDNFQIDDDGTITIDYSHDNRDVYSNLLKWIKSVSLNEDTGLFTVTYNYDTEKNGTPTQYETNLTWIKNLELQEDGTIKWIYTTSEDNVTKKNFFKWIKDVSLDKETGHFRIVYNYPNENDTNKTPTQLDKDLTWVKDIRFENDGTVKLIYTTSGDDKQYTNLLKWITNVNYTAETGLLEMDFNYPTKSNGTPTHWETNLRFVDNIRIDDDGTIHFDYTYGDEQEFTKYLKTIKDVSLDGETGHFIINYNQDTDKNGNSTKYETDLRWVDNITLAENGAVTLNYTIGNDVTLSQKIKWIKTTNIDTDGTFTIEYNDGTKDTYSELIKFITNINLSDEGEFRITYNDSTPDYVKNLVWPINLSINTGDVEGEGNQKVKITYNNGTMEDIGKPLNYIMRTAITDDYHLIILHSDPEKRDEIVAAGNNYTWDDRSDWQDMGSIKDDDGILIGLNLDSSLDTQLQNIPSTISYLNTNYPFGLTANDLKGKIITVGNNDENKKFFAFDYSKENNQYKGWYYLGTIDSKPVVVGQEGDPNTDALLEKLPENGIWFVLENNESPSTP